MLFGYCRLDRVIAKPLFLSVPLLLAIDSAASAVHVSGRAVRLFAGPDCASSLYCRYGLLYHNRRDPQWNVGCVHYRYLGHLSVVCSAVCQKIMAVASWLPYRSSGGQASILPLQSTSGLTLSLGWSESLSGGFASIKWGDRRMTVQSPTRLCHQIAHVSVQP